MRYQETVDVEAGGVWVVLEDFFSVVEDVSDVGSHWGESVDEDGARLVALSFGTEEVLPAC